MAEVKPKNVIITKKGRKKLVQARAGAIELPTIKGMVFGSGGASGSEVIPPEADQEELKHELFRKDIGSYSFPNDTTCRYVCTLTEAELAGEKISEIGLYDTEDDIVAIKTFSEKGKDDDIEMTFTLDDEF